MTHLKTLLPDGWKRPKGYANGIAATGRMVFTAGVVGWDADEHFVSPDIAGQFRQILLNTIAFLAEAGATPAHIVSMTWYVTSRDHYLAALPKIATAYRELIGAHYPAMAVIEVSGLVEKAAIIEVATIVVAPL
jgi:enamine deaminase RidA (YjgF/YER057c/UK114 family)